MTAFALLANFAEFYYQKYLKQEVDDNLSIFMDERSPYGLSVTVDIKIYQCRVIKKCQMDFLSRSCFYSPNITTATPQELEIKRFDM